MLGIDTNRPGTHSDGLVQAPVSPQPRRILFVNPVGEGGGEVVMLRLAVDLLARG